MLPWRSMSTCKGCGAAIEWRRKRSGWVAFLEGKPHGNCYRAWKKMQAAQSAQVHADPVGTLPRSANFQKTSSGLKVNLSRQVYGRGWT